MISPRKGVAHVRVSLFKQGAVSSKRDVVAVEEPLEIRVELAGGRRLHAVSVTMRTPVDDFELAAGFLYGEGLISGAEDIHEITYCQGDEPQTYNIVVVRLGPGATFDPANLNRNFYMTSSCGVCGKASLEAVEVTCAPLPDGDLKVAPALLHAIPGRLREGQGLFERTGGIHAAALFDAEGQMRTLKEDIGRHNAVDKVVGHELLAGRLPLSEAILGVSSRSSFEIMQKAVSAGISTVVAVGAPSSLAVDMAKRFNMTLIGFTRDERFNVYSGGFRVTEQQARV
ncbi:MAG: formate dehydrogenase accessory sulfurtransferase FdhD [Gemmatimonadetes bacterium]|nr:formate dehydrogenase accessory sulfurtransferase FdhD [Gemmatimonadota bacterium]